MKRSIISAAVLSAVFMSAGAFAANETGSLTITGTVENSSCYFKNSDAKSTITLPNIDASRFAGLSTGATVGDGKMDDDSTPMVIVCPVGTELNTVRITGAQFTSGVLNKTAGDANGVGFNLALGDKQITDAEESNLKDKLTSRTTEDGVEYTLDFKAKYARLSSDVPVTAGTLSSVLTISVSAD
ncbi:fimbrial protein [Citrobacter freundii]|jgi:P pilus assembly protein, pilin FimA|uniref:Fimbrial protein n=1 Tax=Citrobacter arsenatis TaxID=2546350 RepID=A0A4P6WT22_9ENTR|nr:fimbrial protein [Citrobacter arsenatis]POT26205.1 fimbrial protein [Citrobacter freundii]QBM24128.1 fimbrial protein [Citrobacter arsenatis]